MVQHPSLEQIATAGSVGENRSVNRVPIRETERRIARIAQWRSRVTTIDTPHDTTLGDTLTQAADDLGSFALLDGKPDEWLAVQAGIPLYPALFGRDAITAGWQAAMIDR